MVTGLVYWGFFMSGWSGCKETKQILTVLALVKGAAANQVGQFKLTPLFPPLNTLLAA